jgi:hypothetical protein
LPVVPSFVLSRNSSAQSKEGRQRDDLTKEENTRYPLRSKVRILF